MKIAIIPARGGSKRIPRKNIRPFLGKPIISYSIKAAIDSKLFDVVMVSTDDEEIAKIAKQYGAEIPFYRSTENSNDFAGTTDVLIEVINEYKKKSHLIDYACCIYPCAPFVTATILKEAFDKLQKVKLDSVFPVVKFSNPIQRSFKIQSDKIEMFYPEYLNTRSQDLEPAYSDAGQFYFFNVSSLLNQKKILTANSSGIIINEMSAQDIDNENDWQLAELKYKMLNLKF